jgi:hypothetical protein
VPVYQVKYPENRASHKSSLVNNSVESNVNIRKERKQLGKALRQDLPYSNHANWTPRDDRADPIDLLKAQNIGRLRQYLPIKYGRMLESSFAFFRGSAVLMAADLADTLNTGIEVNLCGDAHLANFGIFASPERRLVFNINDFDEVYPGFDLDRIDFLMKRPVKPTCFSSGKSGAEDCPLGAKPLTD